MRQEIDGPHGETVLLFIGTPVLKTLADMQAHKLFVSDFPPHDTSAEQMLVASAQQVADRCFRCSLACTLYAHSLVFGCLEPYALMLPACQMSEST